MRCLQCAGSVLLMMTGCSGAQALDTSDTAVFALDPFADAVVDFQPGEFAGYGQDKLPDVVLGAPEGAGPEAGSLDVVSLGCGGLIVLELVDLALVDGDGPDLLVFENAFVGFPEAGEVSVSDDGKTWATWPCDASAEGSPGCAGIEPVHASSENAFDPTDPDEAGGDAFDLADLGLASARFVRVEDRSQQECAGNTGGFDLDAIAVVNGEAR